MWAMTVATCSDNEWKYKVENTPDQPGPSLHTVWASLTVSNSSHQKKARGLSTEETSQGSGHLLPKTKKPSEITKSKPVARILLTNRKRPRTSPGRGRPGRTRRGPTPEVPTARRFQTQPLAGRGKLQAFYRQRTSMQRSSWGSEDEATWQDEYWSVPGTEVSLLDREVTAPWGRGSHKLPSGHSPEREEIFLLMPRPGKS